MEVATRPARRAIQSEPMTIRSLELRDVESVVAMVEQEWPNLWPRLAFDADHVRAVAAMHFVQPNFGAWVLVDQNDVVFGVFGLCISPGIVTQELLAEETWWYVDPVVRGRHGVRLLGVGETWAKAQGVGRISVGVHHEKYRPILERLHYNLATLVFEKAL